MISNHLKPSQEHSEMDVSEAGRWISAVSGGALVYQGFKSRSLGSLLLALAGGYLIYRGVSGHDPLLERLGAGREGWAVSASEGIHVESSVTVERSPEELYRFWRSLENLPRFMNHLESVKTLSDGRSHWIAKAPLGQSVEWDAEIVGDRENELISWRSLPGADVPNAGSVRFSQAPANRGTEVIVSLKYSPPGGALGATIAKIFGEEPKQQIAEDLKRFKQLMEAGETATTTGQPSGRSG